MTTYRRDAVLALCVLSVVVSVLHAERALGTLLAPGTILAGVTVAVLVEGVFLRSPTVADLWERPVVQIGTTAALLAGGLLSAFVVGLPILAALCWGLVTYFVLLGAVVLLGINPVAVGA